MEVWITLREIVILVFLCECVDSRKDLLDFFRPGPNNPQRLNEFLASVQQHSKDFKWIRQMGDLYQQRIMESDNIFNTKDNSQMPRSRRRNMLSGPRMRKRGDKRRRFNNAQRKFSNDRPLVNKQKYYKRSNRPSNDLYPYMFEEEEEENLPSLSNLHRRDIRHPVPRRLRTKLQKLNRLRRNALPDYLSNQEKEIGAEVQPRSDNGLVPVSGERYPERRSREVKRKLPNSLDEINLKDYNRDLQNSEAESKESAIRTRESDDEEDEREEEEEGDNEREADMNIEVKNASDEETPSEESAVQYPVSDEEESNEEKTTESIEKAVTKHIGILDVDTLIRNSMKKEDKREMRVKILENGKVVQEYEHKDDQGALILDFKNDPSENTSSTTSIDDMQSEPQERPSSADEYHFNNAKKGSPQQTQAASDMDDTDLNEANSLLNETSAFKQQFVRKYQQNHIYDPPSLFGKPGRTYTREKGFDKILGMEVNDASTTLNDLSDEEMVTMMQDEGASGNEGKDFQKRNHEAKNIKNNEPSAKDLWRRKLLRKLARLQPYKTDKDNKYMGSVTPGKNEAGEEEEEGLGADGEKLMNFDLNDESGTPEIQKAKVEEIESYLRQNPPYVAIDDVEISDDSVPDSSTANYYSEPSEPPPDIYKTFQNDSANDDNTTTIVEANDHYIGSAVTPWGVQTFGKGQLFFSSADHLGQSHVSGTEGLGQNHFKGAEGLGQNHIKGAEGSGHNHFKGAEGSDQNHFKGAEGSDQKHFKGAESSGQHHFKGAAGSGQNQKKGTEGSTHFSEAESSGQNHLSGAEHLTRDKNEFFPSNSKLKSGKKIYGNSFNRNAFLDRGEYTEHKQQRRSKYPLNDMQISNLTDPDENNTAPFTIMWSFPVNEIIDKQLEQEKWKELKKLIDTKPEPRFSYDSNKFPIDGYIKNSMKRKSYEGVLKRLHTLSDPESYVGSRAHHYRQAKSADEGGGHNQYIPKRNILLNEEDFDEITRKTPESKVTSPKDIGDLLLDMVRSRRRLDKSKLTSKTALQRNSFDTASYIPSRQIKSVIESPLSDPLTNEEIHVRKKRSYPVFSSIDDEGFDYYFEEPSLIDDRLTKRKEVEYSDEQDTETGSKNKYTLQKKTSNTLANPSTSSDTAFDEQEEVDASSAVSPDDNDKSCKKCDKEKTSKTNLETLLDDSEAANKAKENEEVGKTARESLHKSKNQKLHQEHRRHRHHKHYKYPQITKCQDKKEDDDDTARLNENSGMTETVTDDELIVKALMVDRDVQKFISDDERRNIFDMKKRSSRNSKLLLRPLRRFSDANYFYEVPERPVFLEENENQYFLPKFSSRKLKSVEENTETTSERSETYVSAAEKSQKKAKVADDDYDEENVKDKKDPDETPTASTKSTKPDDDDDDDYDDSKITNKVSTSPAPARKHRLRGKKRKHHKFHKQREKDDDDDDEDSSDTKASFVKSMDDDEKKSFSSAIHHTHKAKKASPKPEQRKHHKAKLKEKKRCSKAPEVKKRSKDSPKNKKKNVQADEYEEVTKEPSDSKVTLHPKSRHAKSTTEKSEETEDSKEVEKRDAEPLQRQIRMQNFQELYKKHPWIKMDSLDQASFHIPSKSLEKRSPKYHRSSKFRREPASNNGTAVECNIPTVKPTEIIPKENPKEENFIIKPTTCSPVNSSFSNEGVVCGLEELENGHIAANIVSNVMKEVVVAPNLHKFAKSLDKKNSNSIQKVHFDILTCTENKDDLSEAKQLLNSIKNVLNKLVLSQIQRRICQHLPKELYNYLVRITSCSHPTMKQIEQVQKQREVSNTLDNSQSNYLFNNQEEQYQSDYNPDAKALQGKIQVCENLLSKYNGMDEESKSKAEPIKNYIENHMESAKRVLNCQTNNICEGPMAVDNEVYSPESVQKTSGSEEVDAMSVNNENESADKNQPQQPEVSEESHNNIQSIDDEANNDMNVESKENNESEGMGYAPQLESQNEMASEQEGALGVNLQEQEEQGAESENPAYPMPVPNPQENVEGGSGEGEDGSTEEGMHFFPQEMNGEEMENQEGAQNEAENPSGNQADNEESAALRNSPSEKVLESSETESPHGGERTESEGENQNFDKIIEQELESVGLGQKQKDWHPKFSLENMIQQHLGKVSNSTAAKRQSSDPAKYTKKHNKREAKQSEKYKKLANAVEEMKRKRKKEELIAQMYGGNEEYKKRSADDDDYPSIKSRNVEAQNMNQIHFEEPLVYSMNS